MPYTGIIPALTTPFDADGAVDLAALRGNVHALLDAGVHGVVATGTMGEAGSLSTAERAAVVREVVAAVEGRVPVIAGVSSGTPAASIAYARDAAAAGAEAIMLLPPLGYRADEREIVAFYAAVAEGTGLPIMAYNNPEATGGIDMPAALIARLVAEVENVIVGPKSDPAKAAGRDLPEALRRIAAAKAMFVSRGDRSGTHAAELRYWKDAGVDRRGAAAHRPCPGVVRLGA